MTDLGSFDAPVRKDPHEHTITVCDEVFTVHPRFSALQSIQWAKAIKRDDGMAIGAYTGDIISGSMDKETYTRFEEVVEAHEVDLTTLARIADALMTSAMSAGAEEVGEEDRPTTRTSGSSRGRRTTSKKSKAASSLQDKRDQRMREQGMVPIEESQYLRRSAT